VHESIDAATNANIATFMVLSFREVMRRPLHTNRWGPLPIVSIKFGFSDVPCPAAMVAPWILLTLARAPDVKQARAEAARTRLGVARGWPQRRDQLYMLTLTDPQGLKVWSERPCKHPSCFWA
jgi:hypothetical protein